MHLLSRHDALIGLLNIEFADDCSRLDLVISTTAAQSAFYRILQDLPCHPRHDAMHGAGASNIAPHIGAIAGVSVE